MAIAFALQVPLAADPVAAPRLVHGRLTLRDLGDAISAIYFRTADERLGRVTFEGLDAVRAEGGECPPYETVDDPTTGGWVYTVEGSPWLQARHAYEMEHYSTPLAPTHQHYLFLFHDEYVEAVARGICLDLPDPSQPTVAPAGHPLELLSPQVAAEHFRSVDGLEWQLRRSPRTDDELVLASTLCSQRVYQLDLTLDGSTSEAASIWWRTRDGRLTSYLRRPAPVGDVAQRPGLAVPADFAAPWEEYLAQVADRRRRAGR